MRSAGSVGTQNFQMNNWMGMGVMDDMTYSTGQGKTHYVHVTRIEY